jgi:hypothetical protein
MVQSNIGQDRTEVLAADSSAIEFKSQRREVLLREAVLPGPNCNHDNSPLVVSANKAFQKAFNGASDLLPIKKHPPLAAPHRRLTPE